MNATMEKMVNSIIIEWKELIQRLSDEKPAGERRRLKA
jgi:hypothetical protein